jgi:hypothetical protein
MALRQWLSWGQAQSRPSFSQRGRAGINRHHPVDRAKVVMPSSKEFVHGRYARSAVVYNGTLDVGTHLLQKPFSIDL